MKRTTLLFSSADQLSSFIDRTRAVNVSIIPRAGVVKGLFTVEEINFATTQFGAVVSQDEPFLPTATSTPGNILSYPK